MQPFDTPATRYVRKYRRFKWLAMLFQIAFVGWPVASFAEPPMLDGLSFVDVTEGSGIVWQHTTGRSNRGYIVEAVSAGLASLDYDLDGLVDAYLLNGCPLLAGENPVEASDGFFRNLGGMRFADVTSQSGIDGRGYGLGIGVADVDADGFPDLYLNNFGENKLYMNCGDGTFSDATQYAGVGNGLKVGAGVAFADFDGDELLDLYVGNYVDFSLENAVFIERDGHAFHAGPRYYKSEPDTLFRNLGDGRFEDISVASGIGTIAGPTMGLLAADLNQDGHVDVLTCNDAKPNFFFAGDGKGRFVEDGVIAGLAFDFRGTANASMGIDIGDIDQDGLQDLVCTNYQNELPVVYRNLGEGFFEDASTAVRVSEQLQPHVTWATAFVDFNHDGLLDIYVGCGHFDDAEITDDRTAKKVHDFLLLQQSGSFVDVSNEVGLNIEESTRGAVFEDFDNDGDTDALILNSNASPTLLRNDLHSNERWLMVELVGRSTNRQAVNAKLKVLDGPHEKTFEIVSGRGYQSYFGSRVHVGLSSESALVGVRVTWPGGAEQEFKLQPGRLSKLIEGNTEQP